jgi:hypothetical protein
MAKRKRRSRGLGEVRHSTRKVRRAAVYSRERALPVRVKIGRTSQGIYTAFACSGSRVRVHGARSSKAQHCGALSTGPTPTKAAGKALKSLGDALARTRIR